MENTVMHIYPGSLQVRGVSAFFIGRNDKSDYLAVAGPDAELFTGEIAMYQSKQYKLCPLTVENSQVIRELFAFTNPVRCEGRAVSLGMGDRLGLASYGHIRSVLGTDVFPVLAQQSMRELNLTGRTYEEVLAAAVWAVFREGYTKGYGADGDHLKTSEEVKYALGCGYSMITLDCSEHIRNDYAAAEQGEVDAQYEKLPREVTSLLEAIYLNRSFSIDSELTISFGEPEFRRIAVVYYQAICHAVDIYEEHIKSAGADFEVSIDETLSVTTPQAHFFVANELIRRGVEVFSIAPRFPGEFQKGVDYIGDTVEFERDFEKHVKIAEKFGYKISVHSGSDKFSIFPIVGRLTGGRFHLKTAGTSWLEALRVIAMCAPNLYREIHTFALENLADARKYYHIAEDISDINDISSVADDDLPAYLEQNSSRQVLHITYGLILTAKSPDGQTIFRDRIYGALREFETEYGAALERHLGLHIVACKA